MREPPEHVDKSNVYNVESKSLRAQIEGRVQGVGFRFFVVREARRLGLTGEVRNLPNGAVEVLARGDPDSLQQLVAKLERGPILSRVDHVDVKWGAAVPQTAEFTIGY